jgi:hypothetical protein
MKPMVTFKPTALILTKEAFTVVAAGAVSVLVAADAAAAPSKKMKIDHALTFFGAVFSCWNSDRCLGHFNLKISLEKE